MICKQCGAFFDGKGSFCPHCGADNSDFENTLDLDKTMSAEEFTPPEGFPAPPVSPQEVQPVPAPEPAAPFPAPQDNYDIPNRSDQLPPEGQLPPDNKKKKSTGLVVLVCVLSALLIGAVITMLVLLHPWKSNSEAVTTTAAPSTAAETTAAPKRMPDLIGLTKEDAISRLSELGVGVKDIITTETDSAEPGYVFNQSPSKNQELTSDVSVTIYVAVEKTTQPPTETEPATQAQPSVSSPGYGATLYVTADGGAVLWAEPARTGTQLAAVSRGDAVTYLETSGAFYYVSYRGIKGYIPAESLSEVRGDLTVATAGTDLRSGDSLYCITGEGAKLRSDTSIFSSELATLSRGDRVSYLGQSGDWYYVSYNGKDGYVLKRDFAAQE